MDTRLIVASLHLLALGVGLSAIWARGRALHGSVRRPDEWGAVRRVLAAHAWWSAAAGVWIVTGAWLLISGSDGSMARYAASRAFMLKMALFLGIIALEVWPMMTLLRWRRVRDRHALVGGGRLAIISYVQCAMVIGAVLAAVASAHGTQSAAGAPAPAGDSIPQRTGGVGPEPTGTGNSPRSAAVPLPVLPPIQPTGVETVTGADLALLVSEVAMPLDGVDPSTLRSNYDEARGGGSRQHQALDIMAPRGTPVRSAAKGRVLKLFNSAAGGLMVYAADSSERFILMYAHLDGYAPGLREGAALARGQVIGTVGSTGNASPAAPHLHLAIARSADVSQWSKGKPIDPLPVLQAARLGQR